MNHLNVFLPGTSANLPQLKMIHRLPITRLLTLTAKNMLDILQREFVYVWYYFALQLQQIFRYYALGIVLGSFISVFVKNHIHGLFKALGNKKLGVLGVVPASILGILLSALFQRYVPSESFAALFGEANEGFGVLMAATIGVPLYACGGGTIPLLQAWLYDGMSMGSAAAFMLTGPSTKITNLGALKIVLGIRRFLLYLLFVMLFSFVSGIIYRNLLQTRTDKDQPVPKSRRPVRRGLPHLTGRFTLRCGSDR